MEDKITAKKYLKGTTYEHLGRCTYGRISVHDLMESFNRAKLLELTIELGKWKGEEKSKVFNDCVGEVCQYIKAKYDT